MNHALAICATILCGICLATFCIVIGYGIGVYLMALMRFLV